MNEHETDARVCDVCGCAESDSVELFMLGDELLCEDCAHDAGWEQCEDCGEWVYHTLMIRVNPDTPDEKLVCQSCICDTRRYFQCESCGEYYTYRYYAGRIANSYPSECICDCCSEEYYTCYDCGNLVPFEDAYYDEHSDGYYCGACWAEHEEDEERCIHDYSYKPDPHFFYTDEEGRPRSTYSYTGTQLTFGLELEVDKGSGRAGCAEAVYDTYDDLVYMKSDSSVDFEIVTHPCTLDYHCRHFGWSGLCCIPPRYGYKSHDAHTCGLHIHVGRAQLGRNYAEQEDTTAKIILLMYRHWNALARFSRRSSSQLDRWASKPDPYFGCGVAEAQLKGIALDCVEGNRYYALNTCNSNTVEFRLWNGSLQPNTVLATIEMTSNICRYAMSASFREVCESKWTDLTSVERYPELDRYLEERGLLTDNAYTPSEIRLREAGEPTPSADFCIGDRVRIVRMTNEAHYISTQAVAERPTGTIIAMKDLHPTYVMRFDEPRAYGHACDGLTPQGYGYYVRPECLELINVNGEDCEDGFTLGEEVELAPGSMYYERFAREGVSPRGRVVVNRRCSASAVGVYFPELTFGHNLHLALPAGDTHGWWVNPDELVRVRLDSVSA